VSDKRLPYAALPSAAVVDRYLPDVLSYGDYYAFGAAQPGRTGGEYRYGFNGMEMDKEPKGGAGLSYTTEFRQYDPRVGRWFSPDPIVKVFESPYAAFLNNPVLLSDPSGLDPVERYGFWKRVWNTVTGNAYLNTANKYASENGIDNSKVSHNSTFGYVIVYGKSGEYKDVKGNTVMYQDQLVFDQSGLITEYTHNLEGNRVDINFHGNLDSYNKIKSIVDSQIESIGLGIQINSSNFQNQIDHINRLVSKYEEIHKLVMADKEPWNIKYAPDIEITCEEEDFFCSHDFWGKPVYGSFKYDCRTGKAKGIAPKIGIFEDPFGATPVSKIGLLGKGAANVVYHSTKNGVTRYVGITSNFARRSAQHLAKKGINIEPLMQGLSRADARAVEQALIEIHGLGVNGGTLLNKINSIAKTNPVYAAQLQRGYELLKSIGYQ
jgi:RHS repeat-associated protein